MLFGFTSEANMYFEQNFSQVTSIMIWIWQPRWPYSSTSSWAPGQLKYFGSCNKNLIRAIKRCALWKPREIQDQFHVLVFFTSVFKSPLLSPFRSLFRKRILGNWISWHLAPYVQVNDDTDTINKLDRKKKKDKDRKTILTDLWIRFLTFWSPFF